MADTVTGGKIRVGIIGCGGISGSHLPNLEKFEDVELVAFCDVVVDRAQKKADQYGGTVYDDAEKMLAGTKMDAAYIMIPTYAHGVPERAVLAAGLPFLVEKPMGLYPDDLRLLAKEVEAAGVITAAGFMNRYRKSINHVKDLLQDDPAIIMDGAWIGGAPLMREGDYFSQNPIGQWWPIKEKSGGQFVEQVIHTVDVARYLAGEVKEVYAYAANGFNKKLPNLVTNYTNDDAMVVSLKFESGAIGNIMAACSAGASGGVFLNVWSANHTARFSDWGHHLSLTKSGNKEAEEIKGDVGISSPDSIFTLEDRAFIDAVKSGDRSGIKSCHADGVRSTLVCLAANESIEKGQPVLVQY